MMTAAGEKELGKDSATCLDLALTTPGYTPHSTLHPPSLAITPHSPGGATAPELLSSPPSIRAHSQLPLCQEDSAPGRPGPAPSIRQVARRHGWDSPHPLPNSPHTGTLGSLAPTLLPQKQRKR